jgi:YegS/Rv2252/BmrU family lipid kinase
LSVSRGTEDIATYANVALIYNPFARGMTTKRGDRLEGATQLLSESGRRVYPVATRGPGTGGEIAREKVQSGADLILVAGGDGTVNEVMNGMVHTAVPLGVLPGGTANVLATELGIRGRMEKVARCVREWIPRRVSVGLLHASSGMISRYFLLMAGVGFDAHIVNSVHPGLKRQHGTLSYWMAGFGELGRRLEEFDVRVNGRSFRCSFALASRVRSYGGSVAIARHASLFSDDFGVVLLEGSNTFRYLKYLAGVLTNRLERMEGISFLRAERIEFSGPADQRVHVQVDGEAAGYLPASVEIVPDALTLLTPAPFAG